MRICVHGLGYIGLATAALFANNGHDVTGFDVDEALVARLQRGDPDVGEPELGAYVGRALSGSLEVRNRPAPADYHVVCVPTPYDSNEAEADLSYVDRAARNIVPELESGDTIVLESTVPPGTTTGRFSAILSESGFEPGEDVGLGYTPETVLPGNTVEELRTNDRLVSGVDGDSVAAIRALYGPVTTGTIHVAPDPTTAEFVKLAQNAARDVQIAYANTLALVADDYDVDVRSAIALANNHPRVDILNPGPGVGGHCLPVDPLFLGRDSDETDLIDCAREVNDRMPRYVTGLLEDALGTLRGRTIAVLGVTYKANIDDTRNSPGLAIARELDGFTTSPPLVGDGGRSDLEIRLHDPRASDPTLDLVPLETAIADADAMVIAAGHDEFTSLDPASVAREMAGRIVVDPVDAVDAARWRRRGFEVVGL
jgi:UDP-N-acetyl-D-mannosaminuronic acid dehydrogenase